MSGLRSDISSLYQICPVKLDLALRKCRSRVKTMNLGPDKLTTSKQDTIEHTEVKGTARSNQNSRNHT
jgi:hypothetical protein